MKTLGALTLLLWLLTGRANAIEHVKIGLIIPLTGDQAVFGVDAQRMVEIVAPKGVISREKLEFELIVEDGRCGLGASATSAAQKLINVDKVKFLVVGCSGEAMQVGPLAERNEVVLIAYAASHPGVRDLGDYVFRTYGDISEGIHQMVRLIRREGRDRLALITEESSFTDVIRSQLLKELGAEIVFDDTFHGSDGDFGTLLSRARQKRPNAFYLNTASPKHYLALYSQLRRLGINEPVYSYHSPSDPEVLRSLGRTQDGVHYLGTPEVKEGSSAFEDLLREYRHRFQEEPRVEILLRTSYDALFALIESIEEVGPSSKEVRDRLLSRQALGAIGPVEFDAHGDVKNLNFVLKEIRGGVPHLLSFYER